MTPDRPSKRPRNNTRAGGPGAAELTLDQVASDLSRKVPPQDMDAEKAVLGGILVNNDIFHTILDSLKEDDFYSPIHRTIYQTYLDLYQRSAPIDILTVKDQLETMGKLDEIGGTAYLASLTEAVVSVANSAYYAGIVRDKSMRRSLIRAATDILAKSFEPGLDTDKLMDISEQSVFAVAEAKSGSTFKSGKELITSLFEKLQTQFGRGELVTGVPTGYHKFDELTAGLQPTDLIIIAGRPAMGKTAFALNIAMRAAAMFGVPTVVFSLEMSMEQLIMRMLCSWAKVDMGRMRTGRLDDQDWANLGQAADVLSPAPIYIDDTPALGSLELRARCRRMKAEKNLGLVIVDYLQLMRASRNIDSREQEISDISRNLKALAKELHVPVIALSQLNRKVEERADKRPVLSDLRESGAIEQDADMIIFLYRDEVYNKEKSPKKGIAEIIIGKQRNGPTGEVELSFLNRYTAFENLHEHPQPFEAEGS